MNNSMDKAQRIYDNQTPWDNDPHEPEEEDVENWLKNEGAIWAEECYEEDTGFGREMDFQSWVCKHWERIVEAYIDDYEEPEPPERERD